MRPRPPKSRNPLRAVASRGPAIARESFRCARRIFGEEPESFGTAVNPSNGWDVAAIEPDRIQTRIISGPSAEVGSVAVGIATVFVLQAMIHGHPSWRRCVRLLNLGGLLDFIGAITTGVLTSTSSLGVFAPATPMPSMGMMPLSLVPSVLVPLWTIIHFASLLQLRETRGETVRVS